MWSFWTLLKLSKFALLGSYNLEKERATDPQGAVSLDPHWFLHIMGRGSNMVNRNFLEAINFEQLPEQSED